MSSRLSWSTSRAISTLGDFSDIDDAEPKFDQPQYFDRIPGRSGWYCSVCAPAGEHHIQCFDAPEATSHEQSQAHKDAVERVAAWDPTTTVTWGMNVNNWGVGLNNWGAKLHTWGIHVDDWGANVDTLGVDEVKWGVNLDNWGATDPYDRLRESLLSRQVVPLKKRVKRWIRDMARAEGIEFEEDEDLDNDDTDLTDWTQWGAGGDDWKRPPEEWGFPVGGPPVDIEPDPQATADFKFVEKVAKKRGLTKDRRRLHAFYRLPTEQKISRIQEIVQFIHSH